MIIGTCEVHLSIEQANSLKEKRMIVKSIIDKLKNKFNISIAEVENQDIIKSSIIGFACVTNNSRHANSMIQNVLNFIEDYADAEIIDIYTEIL